jgi:hypothetical protein
VAKPLQYLRRTEASQVTVEIRYDRRAFRVRVPTKRWEEGSKFDATPARGILVDLSIPAAAAYDASSRRWVMSSLLSYPRPPDDGLQP